jgi:predicted ATPase
MLTSLQIQNFKAWRDTGRIRLAPLTVIFGANSAGKSSLGHLLLALKQTALSADRKRALHLGDDNSLIDLGTFRECVHQHDIERSLEFDLGWQLPNRLEVKDPVNGKRTTGSELRLNVSLKARERTLQPYVQQMTYTLMEGEREALQARYFWEKGKPALETENYRLVRNTGRAWPLEEPDKFYRISDQSRARFQNAEFLADFALQTEGMLTGIYYLGPLRDHPRRVYQWSGDSPESVGMRGELTIAAILAAASDGRKLNRGPNQRVQPFEQFIARWLQELGVIDSFQVKPLSEGRKEYEVLVRTHKASAEVKISDVGFGVSQVLPALVQAFYCPPHSTVWMEQPEIHLHPQVQSKLADVFISAIQARENGKVRNVQMIIESHSEHFLYRLQRRVAEGVLTPDDVAIYFCRRANSTIELEPLEVNEGGDILNWPENFFGDEMEDIAARTIANARRKAKLAK